MKTIIVMLMTIFVLVGVSAFAADKTEEDLKKPIDCSTAEGDIRVLESEKTHVAKQVASGVTAVVPAGFVINVVTGQEKKKLKMATGQYNQLLDEKISAIKAQCNIE